MVRERSRPAETADQAPAVSVEHAFELILGHLPGSTAQKVYLIDAAGRVLAADVVAPQDLWPFPRAAMDGFAMRAADVTWASATRPAVLAIVGTVFAGSADTPDVAPGTAVRIATGAPMPPGADAVVPSEDVEVRGGAVFVSEPVPSGRHVFPRGEDARRGEVVLPAGTLLRGGHLALLAALGIERVAVVRQPRVAILTVGDELVEPGAPLAPGQIWESNSYALAAEVVASGAIPWRLGIARDDLGDLEAHIHRGLAADVLIVCAGISVGERDLVREALARAGVRLLFWRVRMKPGAPAAFGVTPTALVFGLPGNPGAAMVAFEELVRPALRTMLNHRQIDRPHLVARLISPIRVPPGRRRYLWARATRVPEGIAVEPLPGQGTATLRSLSDANALIVLDAETAALEPGAGVSIQLLADPEPRAPDMPTPAAPRDVERRVPVVAVVGAKNAGKTLVIERLVGELRRRGYRVGVIKHDVHGFEMDREGTDTWRFAAAGAEAVAIAGPDQAAVIYQTPRATSLDEIAAAVVHANGGLDLLLVEGYSQAPIPKIEVRRSGTASDKPPFAGLCIALVTDDGSTPDALTVEDAAALADRVEQAVLDRR